MPLITTLAGASARGYGGLRAATPSLTGYVSISSAEVTSGGTSTIVFDNIPNVYPCKKQGVAVVNSEGEIECLKTIESGLCKGW